MRDAFRPVVAGILVSVLFNIVYSPAAAAAVPSAEPGAVPPTHCWHDGTRFHGCGAYDGVQAAAYADYYAKIYNTRDYQVYDSDCANFVSQAMQAGGHPFYYFYDQPATYPSVMDEPAKWWAWRDPVTGAYGGGRTRSWSLVDDLYDFIRIKPDPYYTSGNWFVASALSRPDLPSFQRPSIRVPIDPENWGAGFTNGLVPQGTPIFYQWNYTGTLPFAHFQPDHVGISTVHGTDPDSGWTGLLANLHTTDRYRAIWHLIPYNPNWQTVAWSITLLTTPPGFPVSAPSSAPARTAEAPPAPAAPAELTATDVKAVGGTELGSAASQVFEQAMVARQQLGVPADGARAAATAYGPGSLDATRARSGARIQTLFTGTELQSELGHLAGSTNLQEISDIRALGGNAHSFVYTDSSLLPDGQIRLSGSYVASATVAQLQGAELKVATPSSRMLFQALLRQDGGGTWKVSHLETEFASGNEP